MGIFGATLASMQQCFEAKKKEGEALQLCLPQKPTGPRASTRSRVDVVRSPLFPDSTSSPLQRAFRVLPQPYLQTTVSSASTSTSWNCQQCFYP